MIGTGRIAGADAGDLDRDLIECFPLHCAKPGRSHIPGTSRAVVAGRLSMRYNPC
jgi:hypothetical protein